MMSDIYKINVLNVVFDDWKGLCKYYHLDFDIDHRLIDSCRHPDNRPSGHSWGKCEKDMCPFYKIAICNEVN